MVRATERLPVLEALIIWMSCFLWGPVTLAGCCVAVSACEEKRGLSLGGCQYGWSGLAGLFQGVVVIVCSCNIPYQLNSVGEC